MKLLLPVALGVFLLASCEQHKMGYAEKDSEVSLQTFDDSSFSYWIEVDDVYSYDSTIDIEIDGISNDSTARLKAYGVSVSACDSLEKLLVPLKFSSGYFTISGTVEYADADSLGVIDLSLLPDSSELVSAGDSAWDFGCQMKFMFLRPDTVQPLYLSIDVWSVTNRNDTVHAHFFVEWKSVYDPGSGGGMGKIFCENHAAPIGEKTFIPGDMKLPLYSHLNNKEITHGFHQHQHSATGHRSPALL